MFHTCTGGYVEYPAWYTRSSEDLAVCVCPPTGTMPIQDSEHRLAVRRFSGSFAEKSSHRQNASHPRKRGSLRLQPERQFSQRLPRPLRVEWFIGAVSDKISPLRRLSFFPRERSTRNKCEWSVLWKKWICQIFGTVRPTRDQPSM